MSDHNSSSSGKSWLVRSTIYKVVKSSKYFHLFVKTPAVRQGDEKLVYRLILLFSSTEIFSKRRKIYSWFEGKPELVTVFKIFLGIYTTTFVFPLVGRSFEQPRDILRMRKSGKLINCKIYSPMTMYNNITIKNKI